jgi:hypothetical protein
MISFNMIYFLCQLHVCAYRNSKLKLSKRRFCQHVRMSDGRHSKIGLTNFGEILHRAARVRKQKTLKNLMFCHMCMLNITTN